MIKTDNKPGIDGNFFSLVKAIFKKSIANNLFNEKDWMFSLQYQEEGKDVHSHDL